MNITYESVDSKKMTAKVTMDAQSVQDKLSATYKRYMKNVRINGFRKGHVPMNVLKTMLGGQNVLEEVAYDMLESSSREIIDACPARFVSFDRETPVKFDQLEEGKDVIANVSVNIQPDAELGKYTGLNVQVVKEKVTDEMVNAQIEQARERVSTEENVSDRPAENGDIVYIDYKGTKDGVAFDGGTAENQRLVLGSNQMIPGFEDGIVGMAIDEERDLNLTFPKEYFHEDLAGADVVFHIKLLNIAKKVMPELDDEFAADVSDFETFADYRQSVVDDLQKQVDQRNEAKSYNALIQAIEENATVDLNPDLVAIEVEERYQEQARQYGEYWKMLLDSNGINENSYKSMMRPQAENDLRVQMVLRELVKKEGFEVTDDEVKEKLHKEFTGKDEEWDAEKAFADLKDFQLNRHKDEIMNDKIKAFITANNTVEFVDEPAKEEAADAQEAPAEETKTEE